MDAYVLDILKEIQNDISIISKRLDKLENDKTLSDAYPQNEEMQKLIKKEFAEMKKWVKIEVSDRLYENMDTNDGNLHNTVVKSGNILGDMLVNLDKKVTNVSSQVNTVNHIVDALPRGMS